MRHSHGLLTVVVVGVLWGCDQPAGSGDAVGGDAQGQADAAGLEIHGRADTTAEEGPDTSGLDAFGLEISTTPPDEPCLQVTPSAVHFGGKKWGEKATYKVSLNSCGLDTLPVEIYDISVVEGDGLSPEFAVDLGSLDHIPSLENPFVLPAGSEAEFGIIYHPEAPNLLDEEGVFILDYGQVRIKSNISVIPIELPIDGAGVEVECPIPVIKCAEGSQVVTQTVMHLVGTQSLAPMGTVSKYEWQVTQPDGSGSVFIPSYNFPDPTFEVNVAGIYEFELNVWDSLGNKSCMPAKYEVLVVPNVPLQVELIWRTPGDQDETDTGPDAGSDLDLHVTHPDSDAGYDLDNDDKNDPWFSTYGDCYWFNPDPTWGVRQDRDDTDGAGPEIISFIDPTAGLYRVAVHYWEDHSFGPACATLRFYLEGELVAEMPEVELQSQDLWDAAVIDWPSGEIEPVLQEDGSRRIIHNYLPPWYG